VLDALTELRLNAQEPFTYVVGVDIGGTNTRIAVGTIDGKYVQVAKYAASNKAELIKGLNEYGGLLISTLGAKPAGTALDIAGPVYAGGTRAEITNYDKENGNTPVIHVSDLSPSIFIHSRTRLLNDLESCCYGVIGLDSQNRLHEFFSVLQDGKPASKLDPTVHHAVLAAGTGLGAGILVKLPGHPSFHVYPTEFGHVQIPPVGAGHPDRERDVKLNDYLSKLLYEGNYGPEFEDVVSGRGLLYVYTFLTQGVAGAPQITHPSEIVEAALNGSNKHAEEALLIHYKLLMRTSATIAVGMQAKGVLLAGDNMVYNSAFVLKNKEALLKEFLGVPKRHWIDAAPIFIQTTSYNINLQGTLYVARLNALP